MVSRYTKDTPSAETTSPVSHLRVDSILGFSDQLRPHTNRQSASFPYRKYSPSFNTMTAVQREIEGLPSLADIPPEIRFKIYNLIDQPRLVEIRYDEELSTVWSSTKGPLCMHICRESRRETERVYERCFAGRDGEANILFDFRCDVLYFGMYLIFSSSSSFQKNK